MESFNTYKILPLQKIVYGNNALSELSNIINDLSCSRVAIITTKSLVDSEILKIIKKYIGNKEVITFEECKQHTPAESVIRASQEVSKEKADIIVTIGGGTVTDTGKAIRFIESRGIKSAEELKPFVTKQGQKFNSKSCEYIKTLPQIAIPTTLSGSEFTNSCPITNESLKKELYIYDEISPTINILDPEATIETPQRLWASSGIKAIDHTVEQIYANKPQEITTTLSYRALQLLYENLPLSQESPNDLDARRNCQVGAFMAIFGIMNIALGLSHVIGHQIGPRWRLGHGITSCLTLPTVLRFNKSHSLDQQVKMAIAIGITPNDKKDQMASNFTDSIEKLIAQLGLPTRISQVSDNKDDFDIISKNVIDDPLLIANPKPVTYDDVISVLNSAW